MLCTFSLIYAFFLYQYILKIFDVTIYSSTSLFQFLQKNSKEWMCDILMIFGLFKLHHQSSNVTECIFVHIFSPLSEGTQDTFFQTFQKVIYEKVYQLEEVLNANEPDLFQKYCIYKHHGVPPPKMYTLTANSYRFYYILKLKCTLPLKYVYIFWNTLYLMSFN